MKIGTPDLLLLFGYLTAIVLFGLWMGRRRQGIADFTVGGRDMPWWLVLFSIVATETSTVTFLSIPGFGYAHDLTWLQLPMGYVVGRLLVVGVLLPRYFRGNLFTAYEVLEERFGGATKRVASVLFLITRNLADGLRLFLTALVLQKVAGIELAPAVVCIGVATIVYTFFGGMRAVVWTDFVQFVVYMIGAFVAFGILLSKVGGWEQMSALAGEAGKWKVFDFDFDLTKPYVFWAGLVGGAFLTFGTHGADQMMVQRYLCARSHRAAGWALGLSGIVVLAQFAVFLVVGVALWVFYQGAATFERNDEVFATFIVDEVPPVLLGLLLGGVFSAAMSTLSSSLNSSATTAVLDLYVPLAEPQADSARQLRLVRVMTIVFGVIQIGVGIAGQWTVDAVVNNVLAIAGFTTGIILGVFFLGVFTRGVGQRAALVALVVGLLGMTVIKFGTDLAWPWFALVGSLGTFGVGCVASRFSTANLRNDMRRADRLFRIIQLLRVNRTATAAQLASELDVSERTVYRDISDLVGCGVPIAGEAGVGYALTRGLDLPPLMFTEGEIEALVVGARMVEAWGDADLARQARSALAKAEIAMPERLQQRLHSVDVYVPGYVRESMAHNLKPLREAVSARHKVRFAYVTTEGAHSERTVRPLGLAFWGSAWTAIAWCELRSDFRSFRPDRMENLEVLDDLIPDEPGRDLDTFLQRMNQRGRAGDE